MQNNNVEQPESQNKIKAVNSFNTSLLDLFDETSKIFQNVSNEENPIQSISISDDGSISYGWADTKQTESLIEIPSFLKRYIEAGETEKNNTSNNMETAQPAPNEKKEKKDLNSFFKEDWKNTLESKGLKVYSVFKNNNGDIEFNTNKGDISKKEILEEVKSDKNSMYDFDLTDKDVLNIQKEILRSLSLEKLAYQISKEGLQGLPYSLKLSFGGVLKESEIMKSKYRFLEYKASVNPNAKPRKFLVNFEAIQTPTETQTQSETSTENSEKINPENTEKQDTEELQKLQQSLAIPNFLKRYLEEDEAPEGDTESGTDAKEPQVETNTELKNDKQEEPKISNFSELEDKQIIYFIYEIKIALLHAIEKYHQDGGLKFKKQKEITRDRNEIGKALTGEDQKKATYNVSMIVSGGDEKNADFKFQKSENQITGSFTLTVSLGNTSKNWGKSAKDIINQIANATLSTNNSGVKL